MNTDYIIRYNDIPNNDKTIESLRLCAKFLNLTEFNEFCYESMEPKIALWYIRERERVELRYLGEFSYFIKEVAKIANNLFMKE